MKEEQYDTKKWGATDFERYYSGKMPDSERHALEKAALEDPFLDDALEGYAFAKTPVEDINELKKKIEPKKEQAKLIWFKQKVPAQVLRIAAILILFAGFAWLLYPNNKEKPVEIASVNTTVPKNETIVTAVQSDTQFTLPVVPSTNAIVKSETGSTLPKNEIISLAENKVDKKYLEKEIADLSRKQDEDVARTEGLSSKDITVTSSNNTEILAKELNGKVAGVNVITDNIVKGRVVDNVGQPVPFASIKVPSSNTNVLADANGNFAFKNNQNAANVKVDVNAVGFENNNTALNANSDDNKIVLRENNKSLSEVVVVGYGQSKKRSRSESSSTQKVAASALNKNEKTIVLKNAKPIEGWDYYNSTLSQQIKNSPSIDTIGEVILSFDIDKSGFANNILVVKKLSDSCDARAIQILQHAPAMKKIKKGKKTEAVIKF
ncbi:MAG: carboxypeptidase-like regulatory domain-containing protein [Ferruginibacter sp.]